MTIVAELAIHLVGKEEQVVLLDQSCNFQQLLVRIEITRGVVGVADHNGLGARRDDLLKVLDWRQCKACLDVARYGDNLGVAKLGEGVVVGVIGFGYDNLVAWVEADGESHLKGLAAAGGDEHLVGCHVDTVAVVVVAKGAAIAEDACRVAVFQNTFAVRQFTGLFGQSGQGSFGGLDVGLADIEMVHVDATLFGGVRERDEFTDCRLRQLHSFIRNAWHNLLFVL